MEYRRITNVADPLFRQVHQLLSEVFPPEEVLEYSLWKEPLEDPGIRVFTAVHEGTVVGTTEYRYYADWNVAMTDFTIIGREGLGVGRFLAQHRLKDLQKLAADNGRELFGMFAEIYDPYRVEHDFGGLSRWTRLCAAKCCRIWGISGSIFRMSILPGRVTGRRYPVWIYALCPEMKSWRRSGRRSLLIF